MPDERVPSPSPYPHGALPIGTRLGEFEILRVLGVGGFGIVYLALDHLLEREVALKEYMPSTLVERNETLHVTLSSQANADTFALGLRSFVNEARLLARFDHPSLVKVHRFWEANGTAYMAMALYKGRTVRDVRLGMQARPGEAWVRQLLEPLLGAIERLHGEDVYHRDIAPDNILIEGDGRPVLLDFGAARRVITDRSQALTAILKPSYAPIEQYADVQGMKQGAWTDIYALGATVHFLLLGKPPPPAPGRTIHDSVTPLAAQALEGCSTEFLQVIDWMLAPLPQDRPQSVAVVRDALAGRVRAPVRAPVPGPFERTAPLPGAGSGLGLGDDSATLVMPRAGGEPPGIDFGDQATVVMPRGGHSAYSPPAGGSADEDATVVRPLPTAYTPTQRPPSPPSAPPATQLPPLAPAPAPAPRPAAAPMAAPAPAPRPQPTVQMPLPPRAAPPAPAASGWVVPVVAGVAVALLVGGGLWWFLTRPVSTQLPVPVAASMPDAASAAAGGSPAPVAAPTVVAAPATVAPVPDPLPAPAANTPPAPPVPGPATAPANVRQDRPSGTSTTAPTGRPAGQRAAEGAPAAPVRPPAADPAARPATAPAAPAANTSPAPVPAAASADPGKAAADDNRPKSPSERCAKELPLVRLICIDLACNRSEFVKHPECVKLRADQAQKRYLEGN